MTAPGLDADRELLTVSGLLDEAGYRQRAQLPPAADAAAHYLALGWQDGLDPCDAFDTAFLRPFYEAAGKRGPVALTWLELSVLPGRHPPMNLAEADYIASRIRHSPFFDTARYAARLPPGLDPAMHYAVIGELLGWAPSDALDPSFYLDRHEDVARLKLSPLDHYVEMGARERRPAAPAAARLAYPPVPASGRDRPTVLVIVHDASRTGAPILGWNIVRRLARSYHVVTILMRGGAMEASFMADSAATVGPMVWEEWHPAEMARVADRLVAAYQPLFAIANSVEVSAIVPSLGRLGVPIVALVHEFAAYVRPLDKLRDVLEWSARIVFPAQVVARAAFAAFPAAARRRGIGVLAQGRPELPPAHDEPAPRDTPGGEPDPAAWPDDGAFVVLGLGTVHLRKGVDLFLAAAATAVRLAPERPFRFVWIGGGYDPVNDATYSVYLAAQIAQSGLADRVLMLDEVEDLDPAYRRADLFLMASRLDPQPNVAIEAMLRGIPTICFDGASGTAEILSADAETRPLVVPHLDAHEAGATIARLARDPALLAGMRAATARVGAAAYDMDAYVDQVDAWGQAAAAARHAEDMRTLAESGAVDPELALPPSAPPGPLLAAETHVLAQWAVVGGSPGQGYNTQFRRPCAGFHPQAYARAHPDACGEGGANPLAHWVRSGRPAGPWSHRVFAPADAPAPAPAVATVLHAHLHTPAQAAELGFRLSSGATRCDLLLSTETEAMAAELRTLFAAHPGTATVRITPKQGRGLGALLTGFADRLAPYAVIGHIHADSRDEARRLFAWETLLGPMFPMLDLAVATLAAHPGIGLLMPESPFMPGQDEAPAAPLALRLGAAPGAEEVEFPCDGMVWARMDALRPLLALRLAWDDYAGTPHALFRLLPLAARYAGLELAAMRAPGVTC